MRVHSTFRLKCSIYQYNGIFNHFFLKKNASTFFFLIFLDMNFMPSANAMALNTNILPEHLYLYRQVFSFSVLLHPEEEQWRVDTYIML